MNQKFVLERQVKEQIDLMAKHSTAGRRRAGDGRARQTVRGVSGGTGRGRAGEKAEGARRPGQLGGHK
jgi:hypothetical protein